MKLSVKIDTSACILAANCVGVTPKFFQIGDEPTVELLDGKGHVEGTEYAYDATAEEAELLEEAADSCPTRAIQIEKLG